MFQGNYVAHLQITWHKFTLPGIDKVTWYEIVETLKKKKRQKHEL